MSTAPTFADDDRLPHDRAVWRDYADELTQYPGAPAPGTGGKQVSVDRGNGHIVLGYGDELEWGGVKRWRYGWPPRR